MYTFLFDRRSLALLLIGAGVVAVLLFGAGLLVGMRVEQPPDSAQTETFQPLSTFPLPLGASESEPAGSPNDTPTQGDGLDAAPTPSADGLAPVGARVAGPSQDTQGFTFRVTSLGEKARGESPIPAPPADAVDSGAGVGAR